MNKTAITLAYFVLVALGLVASVVILVYRPEALAGLVSTITTVLGLGTVAAVQFNGLQKANEKIERVAKQTNGTLSKKDEQIAALNEKVAALERQLPPVG